MADDSGKLGAREEPDAVTTTQRSPRRRVDYTPLLSLVDSDRRAAMDDGPAFATEIIRKAVVTGALKPGDAIRQDVMAAALSLSKPPVREALRKLESEQLVVFVPNRGFVVAPESLIELREAWELRELLEPAVLRIAAPNLTTEDFEHARELMRLMAVDREYLRHYELNLEYHLTLYGPSQRPHFLETIERAHARCQRYVYRKLSTTNSAHQTPDDGRHEVIVKRLEVGDIDGACASLLIHLEEAAERSIQFYQNAFEIERAAKSAGRQTRRYRTSAKP